MKGVLVVTKERLMFHNNSYFDEPDQLEEGQSKGQIKRSLIRKNENKVQRALQNRDWEQLEDLDNANI